MANRPPVNHEWHVCSSSAPCTVPSSPFGRAGQGTQRRSALRHCLLVVAIAQHEAASASRDQRDLRCLVRIVSAAAPVPAPYRHRMQASAHPGDADERNLITVRVQGSKDVGSRCSGDFMFSDASTEQKPDRDLRRSPTIIPPCHSFSPRTTRGPRRDSMARNPFCEMPRSRAWWSATTGIPGNVANEMMELNPASKRGSARERKYSAFLERRRIPARAEKAQESLENAFTRNSNAAPRTETRATKARRD